MGKSCLLLQYTEGQFRVTPDATIGVEYGSKEIVYKDKLIKLQIWDTVYIICIFRQDKNLFVQSLGHIIEGNIYINTRSVGCILVYDITKRSTFNRIQEWFDDVKADSSEATQMLIVGNKIDLSNRDV